MSDWLGARHDSLFQECDETVLRENNVENIKIQTVARIASIINSMANILEVKS